MEVSIKFDLNKEEDRKLYVAWTKMKEVTLNLEKLKKLIDNNYYHLPGILSAEELNEYFEEMIWKKLT